MKLKKCIFEKNIGQKTMKNLMLFGRVFVALWFIVVLLDLPSADPEGAPIDCNSFYKHPGKCQTDSGKCMCYVEWTGPKHFTLMMKIMY